MKIFKQSSSLIEHLKGIRSRQRIGFVPTMGALHEGHLALVEAAKKQCDYVVVSIFVNPTQFNDPGDLERYPRTFEMDREKLGNAEADVLFFPEDASEIYPEQYQMFQMDLGSLFVHMEGRYRPGHFTGVMNVVSLLFDIVQPHFAFFGLKDYQQYLIIKKMAARRHPDVNIMGVETHREPSGLARSSRNSLLSHNERESAALLYQTLSLTREQYPNLNPGEWKDQVRKTFESHPSLQLEYFEIAHAETLAPLESAKEEIPARAFIAAYLNDVRLIDNMAVNH